MVRFPDTTWITGFPVQVTKSTTGYVENLLSQRNTLKSCSQRTRNGDGARSHHGIFREYRATTVPVSYPGHYNCDDRSGNAW